MSETIQSKLGMTMTGRTVELIRETYARIGQKTLSYSLARLQDGSLQAVLGGDDQVHPLAFHDEIAGMPFYWYTSADLLEQAKAFVFDKPANGPTRLLAKE